MAPAGAIEALLDVPDTPDGAAPRGTAVIAHPHPQFGGTMTTRWCRPWRAPACSAAGAPCASISGASAPAPAYTDEGRGEAAGPAGRGAAGRAGRWRRWRWRVFPLAPSSPAHACWPPCGAERRWRRRCWSAPQQVALRRRPRAAAKHPAHALVLHGELDDTVPLASVMDWARPQMLPVTVVPGGEHFFHGQLTLLKNLVVRHLRAGR
jgi:hypothetical protein